VLLDQNEIDRPIRTILESIRDAWTAENGSISAGNRSEESKWVALYPAHAKLIKHPINQFHLVTTPTSAEQRVLLNNISWQTFETLLAEIGDNRASRLAYDQGQLEIMTPLCPMSIGTDSSSTSFSF